MKPAIFDSLRGYNAKRLLNDLMSGILVAIIALPMSIALGIQSGVTIQQGLITSIIGGFCISLLGGSRFQIGGPTAAFFAIIAGYVADPQVGLLGLQVATFMAGIIILIIAIFRVGGIIKYIPYPVVIAFTSGIGITLLVGQFKDFFGLKFTSSGGGFINKISDIFGSLNTMAFPTLAIGLTTLAIMIILPKINRKIPAAFVALIVATIITVICAQFSDNAYGIATLRSTFGNIKGEFFLPNFRAIPDLNFVALIAPSFVIAFLVSMESLLSCKVADGMTNTLTNPNTELMAQGVANVACALVGGLPAIGALARTTANIKSGATSPISGVIHSITLLIIFFVAMPLVSYIPMASLAAVLVIVALNMAKLRHFGKLMHFNPRDFIVLATTFLLTVCMDLIYGIVGGIIMSIVVFSPQLFRHARFTAIDSTISATFGIIAPAVDRPIAVLKLAGSLSFINIHRMLKAVNISIAGKSELVLDFKHVDYIDVSAAELLAKLTFRLNRNNQNIITIGTSAKLQRQLNLANQFLTN